MVRQEARFHMVMLLSSYSNRAANMFERRFQHEERVRSSDRVEMQEINTFWERELKSLSPLASRSAAELSTTKGIDAWLDDFYQNVLQDVLSRWSKHGQV